MRFRSILFAISLLLCALPAQAEEPFTYMMPQILWPNPRGPAAKTCPTCTGNEMKGVDPARLFDAGAPAAVAKPAVKVAAKPKSHPKQRTDHTKIKTPGQKPPTKIVHKPSATDHVLRAAVQTTTTGAVVESPCPQVTAHTQKLMDQRLDDQAEQYLKGVLAEHPYDKCIRKVFVQLSLWRAYNFMKCGNIECGARHIREALFVDPGNVTARYMLDRCYLSSGIDPKDKAALSCFAEELLKQNRSVAAFVEYEHLLSVAPSATNYIGYARASQKLGQSQLSAFSYSEALKLDPLNAASWRELGLLCRKLGDDKLADNALSQSLALKPEDDVTSNALISLVQKQLEDHPDDPNIHVKLAHTHLVAGDTAEAADEYAKAELIRDGDENFKRLIQADKLAAQSERERAPQIQQAVQATAKQAAVDDFETNGPSPARKELRPRPDVAYNCSCD